MKPLDYIEFKKDDIIVGLTSGNFHSEEEAKTILQLIIDTINKLIPVRHSEHLTKLVLSDLDILPDNIMRSVKHWLVKALLDDDTFVHAYIPLAQFSNRQTGFAFYQIKLISDSKLFKLIKKENEKLQDELRNESIQDNNLLVNDTKSIFDSSVSLSELFESTAKYKTVMEIFVSNGLVHANTYVWKDKKAGYKSLVCALLKDLEGKEYLKKDVSITWNLCKAICANSFNLQIGSNKTFHSASLSKEFADIIPYSSTLI